MALPVSTRAVSFTGASAPRDAGASVLRFACTATRNALPAAAAVSVGVARAAMGCRRYCTRELLRQHYLRSKGLLAASLSFNHWEKQWQQQLQLLHAELPPPAVSTAASAASATTATAVREFRWQLFQRRALHSSRCMRQQDGRITQQPQREEHFAAPRAAATVADVSIAEMSRTMDIHDPPLQMCSAFAARQPVRR